MHILSILLGGDALVMKEKFINYDGPCYVRLAGRKAGLVNWFLSLIGIDTTRTLEIYEDRVEYVSGSLSGNTRKVIPCAKISDTLCGYFKPVLFLLIGIAAVIMCIVAVVSSSWLTFVIALITAVVFILKFHLKKTTLISITADSSSTAEISFRRSLTMNISEDEARQIVHIINELIRRANGDEC